MNETPGDFMEWIEEDVIDRCSMDAIFQVTNRLRQERSVKCLGVDYCSAAQTCDNPSMALQKSFHVKIGLRRKRSAPYRLG